MLERISVPRRAMDFEDYIDILRRNFLWILGPAFAGLVISTVVAFSMQDVYISSALIRIVPQQIPDTLVQNVSSQQLADHINAMAENILSRNTLTNLINTYHLYRNELKSMPLEDVINGMKGKAIIIRPTAGVANLSGRNLPAMQVGFIYNDPRTAKAVCDDLVGRFLSQNTEDTMQSQEQASSFLKDEFTRAKRELDDLNQKLVDFRAKNAGRLPEEMELNAQQMNALSSRAGSLTEALNRNGEQRMMLESAMRAAKDRMNIIKDVNPGVQARNAHVSQLDAQIGGLQMQIEDMKDRYTESFPDLQRARQQLALLQKQREQVAKQNPANVEPSAVDDPGRARERLEAQAQIDTLQTQMKANAMEADEIHKEIGQVNGALQVYQGRLQAVPAGEKEYTELIHDRDIARAHYDELEGKVEKAHLSMSMERRKEGETLEILDPASLPTAPAAPKRTTYIAMGPGIGIVLGIIIAGVREVKDTSLKNLKDARLYTQLSILGSIPLLENDLVVQRRKQIMWVGWATATLAGLAIMAISVAHYYLKA